ncbi:uncharacterized protein [Drosophila tropicalis]|uniref:uncharacterized protein n=1 Tax=Drosophila tropicalis TaxID=46794 RepID=UPI0035AB9CA7
MAKKQGNFLNTRWNLRRPVPKMWVELSVGMPKERGGGIQQLFKVRVDGCHLCDYRSKNRVMNAVIKKLLQSGNYPRSCPLLPNVNYTSIRFALNPDHFPAYMPDMKFNTKIDFYADKNVPLIKASANVEVIRRQS